MTHEELERLAPGDLVRLRQGGHGLLYEVQGRLEGVMVVTNTQHLTDPAAWEIVGTRTAREDKGWT